MIPSKVSVVVHLRTQDVRRAAKKPLIDCTQAFGGDAGYQKVAEYEDRIGVSKSGEEIMNLYCMCPKCGVYMSSKMWAVKGQVARASLRPGWGGSADF